MKRILGISILTLFLSACSLGTLHPTLYNNKVVELISPATQAIESSAISYNSVIPNDVNELTEVDTEGLNADLETMVRLLDDVEKALEYKSENLEQQASIRADLETYLIAGGEYAAIYEDVVLYFENGENQSDPNKMDELDPSLHAAYNTFTEANNDLVTHLASFVDTEE